MAGDLIFEVSPASEIKDLVQAYILAGEANAFGTKLRIGDILDDSLTIFEHKTAQALKEIEGKK